ncbi:hypothetical protein D3C84_1261170 [compost metagenome]
MNGAEFLGGDDRIAVVQAHAAEGSRFGNAQQAQLAGLAENLVDGKTPGFLPFVDVRVDVMFDKLANGAPQCFVFLGEDHF